MFPGRGKAGRCSVTAVRGGGAEREHWRPPHSLWVSVFQSATHNQTGPFWCWFPSGWACAHSRPLWVSPATSPVRLGVSPAAAPTPTGIFNQRFEALFPPCWRPWVAWSALLPAVRPVICAQMWCCGVLPAALPAPFSTTLSPALLVYRCGTVGPQGLLVVRLPDPLVPHSATLGRTTATESSLPQLPSPPLLLVWVNVYFLSPWCRTSLPFDFLSVLVVRGGAVCLPMPPSWFSITRFFILT